MFQTLEDVWPELCEELGLHSEGEFRASGDGALAKIADWLDGYYDIKNDDLQITVRNGIVEYRVLKVGER